MLALGEERFPFFELDGLALHAMRDGNSIDPFDAMRIQNQFRVRLRVVKHCHLAVADYDKLLLLERMQPADEDMCLHAACTIQEGERNVGNRMIEIAAALRSHRRWIFSEQMNDCRNIMRRKAPKNILFGPELAEIKPRRTYVFDPAEFARSNQAAQLNNRRMIVQQVADHQNAGLTSRQMKKFFAVIGTQSQWLFHKNIFSGAEGLFCERKMLRCGSRNYDAVDFGIRK